jgi:hypothetical protein
MAKKPSNIYDVKTAGVIVLRAAYDERKRIMHVAIRSEGCRMSAAAARRLATWLLKQVEEKR